MKKIKNWQVLITSGCSFAETQIEVTWPIHLANSLQYKQNIHLGLGCQGNGMISRKLIHAVHTALKTNKADNLLVGIMWSGPSRHEQYISTPINFSKNVDNWNTNPIKVVDNDKGGWVIYNAHWTIPQAVNYYRYIQDPVFDQIQTLEHVIRVQNYLKLHNIKYFMSTYTSEVFELKNNPNLDHLYEQIEFDRFLPVEGCYEWARDKSKLPFNRTGDLHPTHQQHLMFTEKIIVPFLQDKYNIDIKN